MSLPDDDDNILAYYASGSEDVRLVEDARGQLERTRTQELLARWLPQPPAVVFDVGGGTGHYALWLAERGYSVHLIDPVPVHVEHARQRSASATHALASVRLGDARRRSGARRDPGHRGPGLAAAGPGHPMAGPQPAVDTPERGPRRRSRAQP